MLGYSDYCVFYIVVITVSCTAIKLPFQCRRGKCTECAFEARCHIDFPLFETKEECLATDCEKPESDFCPKGWIADGAGRARCYKRLMNLKPDSTFDNEAASNECVKAGGVIPQFVDANSFTDFLFADLPEDDESDFYIGMKVLNQSVVWLGQPRNLITPVTASKIFDPFELPAIRPSPEERCVVLSPTANQFKLVPCNTEVTKVICQIIVDHCRVIKSIDQMSNDIIKPPKTCDNNAQCELSQECTGYPRIGIHFCCPLPEGATQRVDRGPKGNVVLVTVPPPPGQRTKFRGPTKK